LLLCGVACSPAQRVGMFGTEPCLRRSATKACHPIPC
jgi:hypothetical protein